MSVFEPSYAIKRGNGLQTGGRRLALRANLRPQLELWLGLAWPRVWSLVVPECLKRGALSILRDFFSAASVEMGRVYCE